MFNSVSSHAELSKHASANKHLPRCLPNSSLLTKSSLDIRYILGYNHLSFAAALLEGARNCQKKVSDAASVSYTPKNRLPTDIKEASSLDIFKRKLKTHLFTLAFSELWLTDTQGRSALCLTLMHCCSSFKMLYFICLYALYVLYFQLYPTAITPPLILCSTYFLFKILSCFYYCYKVGLDIHSLSIFILYLHFCEPIGASNCFF